MNDVYGAQGRRAYGATTPRHERSMGWSGPWCTRARYVVRTHTFERTTSFGGACSGGIARRGVTDIGASGGSIGSISWR